MCGGLANWDSAFFFRNSRLVMIINIYCCGNGRQIKPCAFLARINLQLHTSVYETRVRVHRCTKLGS